MAFFLRRAFCSSSKIQKTLAAPLKQKGIISLSGIQSYDLVQGICTNDVKKFQKDSTKVAVSTAFLDTSGRIVADAVLIKPQKLNNESLISVEDELWLECERSQVENVQKHLKKYILRKKVGVKDLSEEVHLWNLINPNIVSENLGEGVNITNTGIKQDTSNQTFAFLDPRLKELGVRVVTSAKEDQLGVDGNKVEVSQDQLLYSKMRMLLGVPEGQEIITTLPLIANLDFLNSVHFQKGCYIGQELTARSYHTGVVRRRIMPFVLSTPNVSAIESTQAKLEYFDNQFTEDLKEKNITDKKGKAIGKVLTSINNVGLAVVTLQGIDKEQEYQIDQSDCSILKLDWFMSKHNEYLNKIKERDANIFDAE